MSKEQKVDKDYQGRVEKAQEELTALQEKYQLSLGAFINYGANAIQPVVRWVDTKNKDEVQSTSKS